MDQAAVANSTTDTSRLSSASSQHQQQQVSKRSSKNFIEKNKSAVSRREPPASTDSSVVIKCLNEVDTGKKTTASLRVKTSETTVLSSSRSSTSSLTSQKRAVKRQEVTTTTASVQMKSMDNGTAPLELEISIISNHSSIAPVKAPSPRPAAGPEPVNKQQIRDFLHELNRVHEEEGGGGPIDPAPSQPSPLQQGEQRCYNANNLSAQEDEDDEDDDLYISQSNQEDKHKVRSLIAGRFSRSGPEAPTAVKRQIIPNFMQQTLEDEKEEDDGVPRNRYFKPTAELPVVKPNFHAHRSDHDHCQMPDTHASATATSIAAMANAVAQPFIRMQNEIEMRMSDVLNKLDTLRKSDDHLSHQLAEKKRLERLQADQDWLLDSAELRPASSRLTNNAQRQDEDGDGGHESKLKYYEQLQEKQFALMSQLISVIGKENRKAARTVEDTKASVRTIKRQFKISDEQPPDFEQYSSQNRLKFTRKSVSPLRRSVQPAASKSRSRSRNRSTGSNPAKRKPRRNKSSTSSRSCSRSRTGSPFKRSLSPLTTRGGLSRSRSTSRDAKNRKKGGGQFLRDLLDQNKSPNGSVLGGGARTSARSLSGGKKRLDASYFDDRPTLFDKYLKQVKNQMTAASSATSIGGGQLTAADVASVESTTTASLKPSMFSDIKEVLKAVEHSKSQIDTNLKELARERDNKMFYLLSTFSDDQNERTRMKKLVDGCVNAISNDVQKVVAQKLIDESKHAKLEAERDVGGLPAVAKSNQQPHTNRAYQKRLSSNQANKVVGFGSTSTTARSSSALEKPKSTVSDTNKYIGKVYGRTLLDEIKQDEVQARNALRLQQQQQQRENMLKARQAAQKNVQAAKAGGAGKKPQAVKSTADPARPAFVTSQFIPYPENKMKSFQTNVPDALVSVHPKSTMHSNVAMVTVVKPKSKSPALRRSKELTRQDLPAVNITPAGGGNTTTVVDNQTRTIETSTTVDESDFTVNQSGTGIHLPGHKRPAANVTATSTLNNKSSSDNGGGDLSNETGLMTRVRDSLENGVLDWIEQELMARYIQKMAREHEEREAEVRQFEEPRYDEVDFEEDESPRVSKSSEMLNVMGKRGFQIFVDVGQPVDPNLIEALAREVLEEKVASMISNGLGQAKQHADHSVPPEAQASSHQPQPSPRRPVSDYYLSNGGDEYETDGREVSTPIPTPHESPAPTPRAVTPRLTPQVSVERNDAPPPPAPQQQPQFVYLIPQAAAKEEDSSSLYEEITEEEQNEVDIELDIDPRTINVPKTPEETPIPTPSPEATPEASFAEPPPAVRPQPRVSYATTSVQCDPEPPVNRTKTPPPPVAKAPSPKPARQSKLGKIKVESISIEPSETELTASSSSNEEDLSTTELDTSKSSDLEDSYMSEGAWIISKSEGQIVFEETAKAFTDLDLAVALKGRPVTTRRNLTADTASEGEIRCDKIGSKDVPAKRGKSRISMEVECGELSVGETKKILKQIAAYDKSEGEAESSSRAASTSASRSKSPKKLTAYSQAKPSSPVPLARRSPTPRSPPPKSPSPTKGLTQHEKTVVDLSVSPKRSSKNNIRVQPINNDMITLRNSNDFERKIISSTPDTSMLAGPNGDNMMIAGSNPELNELEQLLNDNERADAYEDDDEYDLREYERKLRQVQASSDAQFTERDEDTTLNESTDIET